MHHTAFRNLALSGLAASLLAFAQAGRAGVAPPFADLGITKTGFPATVSLGQPLTYSLVVSNLGPFSASTNVVVHDFLPPGVSFDYSMPPGTFDPVNQSLDVPVGNLSVGAMVEVTVVVEPTDPGLVVNRATVTADTPDPLAETAWATNTVVGTSPTLVLNCSSNIDVTATSSNGAVVFFTSSASGGCNPPPNVTCLPPSGSLFPIGTTTVTCTASDSCGDSTNCSFMVTVSPPVYPPLVLNCSSNIIVAATSPNGTVVFFTSSASGGCSPPPNVTCLPPSGSLFPIGTTTVTCTASDSCGDSTNCSFMVTVSPPVYPPLVLNCSSNISVAATSSNGAVVFFTSSAAGGCSPPPNVTCLPPSGSLFPIGTTTVTCTASDSCGDSTNCSFMVTVSPPVYPPLVLNCSSNISVTATSSNGAVVFFTSSAAGGCSPPPNVTCLPPSGSLFPIGTTTVTCTASDSCGDSTNCSFMVTVSPPVYPPLVLNCSSNIDVAATGSNGAVVFFTSSASGGCSPPPNVTCLPPSGSLFSVGTTTVTCTASDSCGDYTNCSFSVTVTAEPISLACPGDITNAATDLGGATVFFAVAASGGCGPLDVVARPPSGNNFQIGSTTVMVTATDACGNSNTCSFSVIVTPLPGSPIIVSQPQSQIVAPGADVLLSVSATGASPLAFQWRFAGAPLPGATSSTLFIPSVVAAYEGVYDVVVSNLVDYFASDPALLVVQPLEVSITASAGSGGDIVPAGVTTTNVGSGVEFTAQPNAGYEVNHWYLNGEPVQDGGTSYILDGVTSDLSVSNDFRLISPPAIPVQLRVALLPDPPQVLVNVTGDPTDLATIEESPDLINWMPATTLSNYTGQAQFTEPLTSSNRFYRVNTGTPWPTLSFLGGSAYDSTAAGALVLPEDLSTPIFSWLSFDSLLGQSGGSEITASFWQVVTNLTGVPQAIEFAGQVQNAIITGTVYLSNAVNQATVTVTRTVQGVQQRITYTLSLLTCKILADSNRDGVVDANDDTNKTIFTTGPNGWGATILVNCDDDDGDHVPDNWPGGSINGVNVPPDTHVNGAADLLDIGQVVVKRTGVPLASLPSQFQVRLQVTLPRTPQGTPLTEPEYFTNLLGGEVIPPERRVRLFLPTQVQGQNLVLGPADNEILGPTAGATAVFLQNPAAAGPPAPGQYNYSILAGNGQVNFGIEGIEFAASVDVRLQYYFGSLQLCSDRVRIKTAPFLLLANNNPVTATIVSSITSGAANNAAFTAAFDAADNVPTTIIPAATANNDIWAQDEWEIGFTQVPSVGGGTKTRTVVLDLPRNRGLGPYAIQNMLSSSVGVFELIKGTASGNVFTYGGNLECSGPVTVTKAGTVYSYPLGRIIVGDTGLTRPDGAALPRTLRNFLFAQGIQDPVVLETGWLGVGHVDEVMGVVPDASGADVRNFRMVIGSATRGINDINGIAAGDNAVHIMNGRGTPYEMTVGEFKGDTRGIRSINTTIQNRFVTPIQNQLQRELNITLIQVPALYYTPASADPRADPENTGTARLRSVTVNAAATPFDVTQWALVFQADPAGGVRFQVRYQRAFVGGPAVTAPGFGKTGADFDTGQGVVVPSASWVNPAMARADDFFFWTTAKPANVFEVGAWIPGLQNAQVANNRVLAPDPQGPIIAGSDVIQADYEALLAGLGLVFNYPAPASEFRWYHRSHGEVHCGSNRYSTPYTQAANLWWMQPPPTGP